ncbi:hypothetical protein DM02DRAFT_672732 [Periconia macrospinosa]|uniref:Uncharacterized protein n=1 Tax=Periconia macrospinosa TaxID=97972 RepID=A0A2V1DMH2_9PLEO|nr:hypothetical protein DM02DRAFT_672732 [Periconia macrospinosa]
MGDSTDQSAGPLPQGPASQANWQFVTISHPLKEQTESTRRRIRSQASRHHHQRMRALKEQGRRILRKDEIELDTALLLRAAPTVDNYLSEFRGIASEVHSKQLTAPPGFGRFDPFFNPPIQMHYREYELFDHLFDQSCVMFRAMHDISFFNRARMTVAFRQLLAMSSWHLSHLNQNRPDNEYLKLSISATQELQKQIDHPLLRCTDDAVIAVLVFLCCANLINDTTAFIIHRNGLRLMLDLRGGIQTLDATPGLRIMLYWADVNGSCLQDIPVRERSRDFHTL